MIKACTLVNIWNLATSQWENYVNNMFFMDNLFSCWCISDKRSPLNFTLTLSKDGPGIFTVVENQCFDPLLPEVAVSKDWIMMSSFVPISSSTEFYYATQLLQFYKIVAKIWLAQHIYKTRCNNFYFIRILP